MRYPRTPRPLAVLGAAALLLTACGGRDAAGEGGGSDPGITDAAVKLGTSFPLSGPASSYAPLARAMQACFKDVNAGGGVKMGDGKTRTVEFTVLDDGYQPDRTLENARRLITQEKVFALFGVVGTATNGAIVEYVNGQKVPHVFLPTGAAKWGTSTGKWPWTIGWLPAYSTESAIFAEYLKKEKPNAEVAILYQNDDAGKDYLKGFEAAAKGSGITIVDKQSYQVTDPSVGSQMANLASSKADVLLSLSVPKFTAQAIREKNDLGWDPLHMVASVGSSIEAALKPAGLDASKGMVTASFMKDPSSAQWKDSPEIKEYVAAAEKYGDFNVMGNFGVQGFAMCQTMLAALEKAEDPTRAALMDAIREMEFTSPLFLAGVKIDTIGPEDDFPIEAMRMVRFNGERYEPLGEVIDYENKTPA